jgi:hypothetical protein
MGAVVCNHIRLKLLARLMHITPFFEFVLLLVVPGALAIVLVALWTGRT